MNTIETELTNILGREFTLEVENRVQEKIDNDAMLNGYQLIIGALCALLAMIESPMSFPTRWVLSDNGKREFARYMSIGMTPEGMRKMFGLRPLLLQDVPVLITLPNHCIVCMVYDNGKLLESIEFLSVAPIVPIVIFIAAIFGLLHWHIM